MPDGARLQLPSGRVITYEGYYNHVKGAAVLARAIERVLADTHLVRGMLAAQRGWLQRNHPQQVVKEYERLYEQIATDQTAVLQPVASRADIR